MASPTPKVALPYILRDQKCGKKYGVMACSYKGLVKKARKRFCIPEGCVRILRENDGVEIDSEFFKIIPPEAVLLVLCEDEDWIDPEGFSNTGNKRLDRIEALLELK